MRKNWTQIACVVMCAAVLLIAGTQRAKTAYSSPVTVTNTPLTIDGNNNSRNVVRLALFGTADSQNTPLGDISTGLPYTVPAGKRLVVQYVSLIADPPTGTGLTPSLGASGSIDFIVLPMTLQVSNVHGPNSNDSLVASIPVLFYVDANNQILFDIVSQNNSWGQFGFWDIHATGYLIDCNGSC